jgi:hypothetical protein
MRAALEQLTGKTFVKILPSWLRNPLTNRALEIDAWNEELKLACEFQGYQHTTFPNCFHKTYDEFERQQQRDKFKAKTLHSLGIRLLEVPHTVAASEIPSFLAGKLSEWNLLWPHSTIELSTIIEEEQPQARPTRIPAGTPCCVDMSQCLPLALAPGTRLAWMAPVYTMESFTLK